MTDISRQDMKSLIQLQESETHIVEIGKVLEKFEKQQLKLEEELKKFGNSLEEKKQALLKIETVCRDFEMEIKVIDDRIVKSNENLRLVRTNKEYQVLLREVDDNKKRKDAAETQLLEYLDEKEQVSGALLEKEKEYGLLEEKIKTEQDEIEKQSKDDKLSLQKHLKNQEEIGKNLAPSLMDLFTRISKMNNGLAVVNVKNAVCMGCFMNIPPQLFIEVQRCNSLISCPQCSRILYYIVEKDPA